MFFPLLILLLPLLVGLWIYFLPLDRKKLAKFWLPLSFGIFLLALYFVLYQWLMYDKSGDAKGIWKFILTVFSGLLSFSGLCLLPLLWRWKANKKICWIDKTLLAAFIFPFLFVFFFLLAVNLS